MGILDDAIRQHLELKRQHGAASTELDQLEQEVFGPATRPGDPEFETGEEPAPAGESELPVAADGGSEDADWLADEDPTTVVPEATVAADPRAAAEPESVEQPIPEAPEEAIFDVEDAELGDVDLEEESRRPPSVPARSIRTSRTPSTIRRPRSRRCRKSSKPRRRHRAAADSAELETSPHPPADQPGSGDPEIRHPPRSRSRSSSMSFPARPSRPAHPDDEDDEDLLEETPDFLKDAPDGEDLWFEARRTKGLRFRLTGREAPTSSVPD